MYGKLFSQMYDGTLATKGPWEALVTFQQLIILADKRGIVDMTVEAIARRTTIPLQFIQKGIAALLEPDPESRSPDEEGRRITRLSDSREWGWQIVNYDHYRKIRSAEERREYLKKYQRDRRAKVKAVNQNVNMSTGGAQSQPIAVSNKQRHKSIGAKTRTISIPDKFCISERVKEWANKSDVANLDAHFNNFVSVCKAKGYTYVDWDEALMRAVRDNWAKVSDLPQRIDGLAL